MAEALSRRELLRLGALGGAGLILGPGVLGCGGESGRATPRIVVVGAGLAGLSCAYRLQQRGLGCTVYEANPKRIGGRCWTARGFAGGQTAEHGGEFIDSRHKRIRALAKRFGFELTDLYRSRIPAARDCGSTAPGAIAASCAPAGASSSGGSRPRRGGSARTGTRTPRPPRAPSTSSRSPSGSTPTARAAAADYRGSRCGRRWQASSASTPTG